MSEIMVSARRGLMLYKMAVVYVILFSVNALATAVICSFLNTEWSAISPTKRFLLVTVILQNWTGVLLAFFNKSINRAEQGQFPIPTGDTSQWQIQPPPKTISGATVAPGSQQKQ